MKNKAMLTLRCSNLKTLEFLVAKYVVCGRADQHSKNVIRAELKHNKWIKRSIRWLGYIELRRSGIPSEMAKFIIEGLECHHILPVSLGGTNDRNNFALAETELHKSLHRYINNQLGDLRKGRRIILIPDHPQKRIVWTCGGQFRGVPIKLKGGPV